MMDLVVSLVRFLTQFGYEYVVGASKGHAACNEAYQNNLMTDDALRLVYQHMFENRELSGCCLHWSLCLLYLLRSLGYRNCGLILTPEPNGMKVSVYYVDDDRLFVADIVEYIKGVVKNIEDISHIPYDEFVKSFSADTVCLIDLDKVKVPLMDFLFFQLHTNTTPDEILKKE